jgi:hypothetical protein
MKNTNETDAGQSERGFTREELIRRGAQDLIQKAIEVEVQASLASFEKVRLLGGRRAVVRNGYLPERDILTPMGEIPVRIPKVRDRSGNGVKFNAALVPPFASRGQVLPFALFQASIINGQDYPQPPHKSGPRIR